MSLATLVRRMAEAGAPAEAIALAIEEIEALQASIDARRGADRDRKRAQREREKSADVTGQSEDGHGTVTPKGIPFEVSPQTPLPKTPSKIAPLSPPIPDWMPPQSWAEFRRMRKAMRNVPFTIEAERRVIQKIERLRAEGHCPEKLLSKAIERGHRSVFEGDDTLSAIKTVEYSPAQLRERAEFYDKIGRRDNAAECRQKAAALEARAA